MSESPAEYETLTLVVDRGVATITLNRPERLNAITGRMTQELRHAMATAERDAAVRGIVLTGEGRGFCAGADLEGLRVQSQGGDGETFEADQDLESAQPGGPDRGPDFEKSVTYLLAVRKPIIGAINGPCAGMGVAFAAACDVRLADESTFFVNAFAQRGLIGEHATTWLLPRLIGHGRALDMMWTGRRIGAEEAKDYGLINQIVPKGELLESAKEYVRTLARTTSPLSMMHMKQQVYADLMRPLGVAMVDTEARMAQSFTWPDFAEGVEAFQDRREPNFPDLDLA